MTYNDQIRQDNTWVMGISIGQLRPYRKGAGSQCSPIFGFLSIYVYSLWRRTTKFDLVRHMGRGLFLEGQPSLHPKRAESKGSPILEVPFYLCVQPLSQNYQIWRGNTYGEGACFRWLATPPPKWGGSQRPPILGFITMYLHPLPQNYQIWRGNTWGMYVLGSPRLPPKESGFSALPCSFWGFSCTGCGKIK